MKKLLYAAVFLVLLLVVGVVALYVSMGRVIKAGVETVGPKVTKCQVKVGSISVSPITGKVVLKDMVVMNPEGFSDNPAFSLGEVRVRLRPKTLFSDRVVVEEIYVDAPAIRYEVTMGGTNVGHIQKNVAEFAAQFGGDEKDQPEEVKEAKKLQINDLLVKDGKITLAASVKGIGTGVPISLPDVHRQNIGAEGRKSSYEVVSDVLKEVLGSVASVAKDAASGVLGALKGIGGTAGDAAKGLGTGVKEGLGGAVEGVKGFFK